MVRWKCFNGHCRGILKPKNERFVFRKGSGTELLLKVNLSTHSEKSQFNSRAVPSYQHTLSNPRKMQLKRSDVMKFLSDEREYRLPLSTTVYVRCVGDAALLLSCESLGRRRSFLSLPLLLQHSDHHFLPTSWTCLHSLSYSSFWDLLVLHLALSSWCAIAANPEA